MNNKHWPEDYIPAGATIVMKSMLPTLPPTVNSTYNNNMKGNFYKKTVVKDWQSAIACIFANHYGKPVSCDAQVGFYILIRTKSKRGFDIDNRVKAAQDCLKMGGVLKDDNQIWDLRVIRELHKDLLYDECEVVVFLL